MGIVSRELLGAEPLGVDDQSQSSDVLGGFVADAFLANWDVIGLEYDNILRTPEGDFRVDNGGSFVFRARGARKDYPIHEIRELESMRDSGYPAGRVFRSIDPETIRAQAQILVDRLTERDLEEIVREAGFSSDDVRVEVLQGLLGRRQWLIRHFNLKVSNLPPKPRFHGPSLRFGEGVPIPGETDKTGEVKKRLMPKVTVLADHDSIENQELYFLELPDGGLELQFKLTAPWYENVTKNLGSLVASGNPRVRRNEFFRIGGSNQEEGYPISTAHTIHYENGVVVYVAEGRDEYDNDSIVRSSLGLVSVKFPPILNNGEETRKLSSNELELMVRGIFRDSLCLSHDAFDPPRPEAEIEYRQNRYRWHHCLKADDSSALIGAEHLRREEVFPGYHTFVDDDRGIEYFGQIPYAIIHMLRDVRMIANVFEAGGLMSTLERFRRGLMIEGLSSRDDIMSGGADSVFCNMVGEWHAERFLGDAAMLVFAPTILDRTDWYAYGRDNYGSTRPTDFASRLAPSDLISGIKKRKVGSSNELMFRTGISESQIIGVVCGTYEIRDLCLEILRQHGIRFIGNTPIEECVVVSQKPKDAIATTKKWVDSHPSNLDDS